MATKRYNGFTAVQVRNMYERQLEKEMKEQLAPLSYTGKADKERKESNALYLAKHLALTTVADICDLEYQAVQRVLLDS